MEFLRFGSSIPGSYWGCCACCIIQNFRVDPDAKASIQIVEGDGGQAMTFDDCEAKYVGTSWRDIFWHRLRFGTFSTDDMPNHAFFAILTQHQISEGYGAKWLEILKEAGFEFIRAVDNSVYTGPKILNEPGNGTKSCHPNYIFGLFRNIGAGAIEDPFTPPDAWTALEETAPQLFDQLPSDFDPVSFNREMQEKHLERWKKLPKEKWYRQSELEELGVPVTVAGMRSDNPQECITKRNKRKERNGEKKPQKAAAAPFSAAIASPEPLITKKKAATKSVTKTKA